MSVFDLLERPSLTRSCAELPSFGFQRRSPATMGMYVETVETVETVEHQRSVGFDQRCSYDVSRRYVNGRGGAVLTDEDVLF